jgi:hypothetical protein
MGEVMHANETGLRREADAVDGGGHAAQEPQEDVSQVGPEPWLSLPVARPSLIRRDRRRLT